MKDEEKIGLQITEEEYRDLPYPSYSLLSDISKVGGSMAVNGVKNTNINDLDGVLVGKMVDNLITENKMPDNVFIVKKKPTGKVKEILLTIARLREYIPNQNDLFHIDNHDLLDKICGSVKYLKERDKRLAGLKNYEEYYKILCTAPQNSFIISEYLYYDALKLVGLIKTNYPMMIRPWDYNYKIIPQVKLLGKVNGIEIKGMLDFVVIDEEKKIIYPYDLKTGSNKTSEFFEKGYLGWNYYIQSCLYRILLEEEIKKHPLYKDYTVNVFRFMYVGRIDKQTQVMEVNDDLDMEAFIGFEHEGKYYKGVLELIEEYQKYKFPTGDNCLKEQSINNGST